MSNTREKVGLWMIGAGGGVGSTVALGVAALRLPGASSTGLVTQLPPFLDAGLVDPASLVIGGHEIRGESLLEAVQSSHRQAGLFQEELIRACAGPLTVMQRNIRPGTLWGASSTVRGMADEAFLDTARSPAEVIERLTADLTDFRRRKQLDRLIVIHLASSEPPLQQRAQHAQYSTLKDALGRGDTDVLPPSSLYALAAIEAGCVFINFTPSAGMDVPALRQRADRLGVPYMGNDGKTGETLVKSVLAPLFAMRNLRIHSWVGQNLLGNRDGAVLNDPATRASKIQTKDRVIPRIVGGSPTTRVGIEYIPSLSDWKVAWDFIHFEGFLGTKMNMQFTWQGSDSALAAPLVIDLARLAALEMQRGAFGPMRHLAFFFKDPIDVDRDDLFSQWQELTRHVADHRATR